MRKFFLFVFLLPFILIDLQAQTSDLFFSEYIEGSSNNKALEIYNGTGTAVDLSNYQIAQAVNGGGWQYYHIFPTGATIADGDVWVIITDQVDSLLFDSLNADEVLAYPSVVHHNGDDARALIKIVGTDTTWLDIIGDPNNDPGTAWDVAGVVEATANHTLVRKPSVTGPNADWAVSAGIDSVSSEWLVYPQDTFKYLGFFGLTVDVTFEVDMGVQVFKGLFNIGTVVNISGSLNGWNTTVDEMTDVDGDTIYTITKSIAPGEVVNFKFHKGVEVDAGYETLDNRTFTVPSSKTATYSAYFNNDSSYQILTPVSVTFSCDMEFETVAGRFNPITDTLTTRGNFNGWSNKDIMSQSVGDPNIYEFTKTYNTFEGDVFSGKFAYQTSSGLTWENDPNKEYTVTADDITNGYAVVERRFNNLILDNVTNNEVTIKFTVDMAGAVSSITSTPFTAIEDVRLCGANPPLRWPGNLWPNVDSTLTIKLNDSGLMGDVTAGDGIWSKDVVFAKYSPLRLDYKYGANWGLPSNTGGNDNESSSGDNHIINLTSTMLSGTVYNTWATMGTTDLTDVTGVENQLTGTPKTYELNQNYPNPFNPSTLIRYAIPEAGIVTLRVFNLLGEEVATLVDGFRNAGGYEVTFDASSLSSGIYFYQITSNKFISTKKMMLMK